MAFYEFMVPLVKGYSTEMSLEVTSLGVQVHGGMGFIEETGAAQYYRDAKILTIYEGTTAIQANDLVGRKTARDGGQTAKALAGQVAQTESELAASGNADAHGRGQAPQSRPRSLCGRGRVCGGQHQGPPQRRVCRQRALPHAGRQPDGRLANGPRLAGGARRPKHKPKTPPSWAKSPPRVFMPTTSCPKPPASATASSKARQRDRDGTRRFLKSIPTII
jgi:hypothetical protein